MLEVACELAGPVNDESSPLAPAAPEQVPTDANDVPVPPPIKTVFQGGIFFSCCSTPLQIVRGKLCDRPTALASLLTAGAARPRENLEGTAETPR